jgi:protein-L-isoaspartate(D-aspartate) O-methyltransferase
MHKPEEEARGHREVMVDRQIRQRGVRHEAVLRAMEETPREAFMPPTARHAAYEDAPYPILEGQTISQPYVVAYMIEALRPQPHHRFLEVGTGSGYAAAVLSHLVRHVYTIERHPVLAYYARDRFRELGYDNITDRIGDGSRGWPEHAPYPGILVSAGAPAVPDSLLDQLAPDGRLVIPIGPSHAQELVVVHRRPGGGFEQEDLGAVRFVPLIGREGWSASRVEEQP